MTEMSFFRDQEIARRTARQHAENHGRLATTRAVYDTFGVGSFEFPECADFQCIYIEEPTISVGFHIELDQWQGALQEIGVLGDQPNAGEGDQPTPLPALTGLVTDWVLDDNGFYVGAFCAALVYFPYLIGQDGLPLTIDSMPEIHHHFRFEGVALKGGGDDSDAENGSASS